MPKSPGKADQRSTIRFRPEVASWLDHEKVGRKHGRAPNGFPRANGQITRDAIVAESVVLLSHVQNSETMEKIFGKDAEQVRSRLLKYLSSNQRPSG